MSSPFDGVKMQFQNLLHTMKVSNTTIADLAVRDITTAQEFLMNGSMALNDAIAKKDRNVVHAEVERLLKVKCRQGAGMKNSDRDQLAVCAMLMPDLANRESKGILDNATNIGSHFSEQFPPGLGSTEQKEDYSIGQMVMAFNQARPGVLKPSARPANKLMNALLQFALTKAGHKQNAYALTAALPNFGRLAMKAGTTEHIVGGADSSLVEKREGSEVEPKSIGAIGLLWSDYLRYAQAMLSVKMPDGKVYGQEAGFIVLEECYAEYASQRKTVAAVCSALTQGWKYLCDELVTSSDSFVVICRNMKKSGIWEEAETNKRPLEQQTSGEVKRLKAENASLQRRIAQGAQSGARPFGSYQANGGGGAGAAGMVKSMKPCFNYFAGKKCSNNPCPFRHDGEPPAYNPARSAGRK